MRAAQVEPLESDDFYDNYLQGKQLINLEKMMHTSEVHKTAEAAETATSSPVAAVAIISHNTDVS